MPVKFARDYEAAQNLNAAEIQQPWGAHHPSALAALALLAARHTPLGRGASRRILFKLFEATHCGPVDVRINGRPMRLYPARNVSERKTLLRPDRHDPLERSLLRRAMAAPGSTFVDIGANAGLYSLEAAVAAGPGSRIVAVEPNADLIGRLRFNEALARVNSLIEPSIILETCSLAISDSDGFAFLSQTAMEGSRRISSVQGHPVETRTLAGLVQGLGIEAITALKIDVEGYEDRALVPFLVTATDAMLPGLVIMEHGSRYLWAKDCFAACERRGYRMIARTRNNSILQL